MDSFDPDHALAILLQARFNEEAKKGKKENEREYKENHAVPESNKVQGPKPSVVDPDWEMTDPCPDIHGLFVSFNDRFFWGRLHGVVVKWSPQMTSCAGICVYEGRNGLCSVRLSAPLLKLRPRSDLIETMLHEMIHAYLFVTNNNRDRDGHGPEFHKHMYRINKEAGTNITVYHSFHAEVKLYKQHWWRCQGPCQSRAPFFGMVKRARNRVPGPLDLWWGSHQAECGGTFVKVREPEGYTSKKTKGPKGKAPAGKDIRNFFKSPTSVDTTFSSSTKEGGGSNVFGFGNILSKTPSPQTVVKPTSGNALNRVVGFSDLLGSTSGSSVGRGYPVNRRGGNLLGRGNSKTPQNGHTASGPFAGKGARGKGGMLMNRGGGTLVVTGKGRSKPEEQTSPNTKLHIDTFKVFSGEGHTLGSFSGPVDRSRSRLLSIGQGSVVQKKPKLDEEPQKLDEDQKPDLHAMSTTCNCSVCGQRVLRKDVDVHLETCSGLQNIFDNSTTIDLADEDEVNDINRKYKQMECPVCSETIEGDINLHLDECLNTSGVLNLLEETAFEIKDSNSDDSFIVESDTCNDVPTSPIISSDSDIEVIESEERAACPICGMRFGISNINDHVNHCLDVE